MRACLIACLLFAFAPACSDSPNPIDDPDAAPLPPDARSVDANPACPEPTSVLPDVWRPINQVSTGVVEVISPGVVYVDARAGGFGNTADNPYTYLRFSGEDVYKVDITDVESYDDSTWDLGFKRQVVRSNSGDSGPGNVLVGYADAATLEEVTEVPAPGLFQPDNWVDEDCEYQHGLVEEPSTAIGTWYEYLDGHRVVPLEEIVYVIKKADGSHYKLKFLSFYDEDNESGHITFEWAPL